MDISADERRPLISVPSASSLSYTLNNEITESLSQRRRDVPEDLDIHIVEAVDYIIGLTPYEEPDSKASQEKENADGTLPNTVLAAWVVEEVYKGHSITLESFPRTAEARRAYLVYYNLAFIRNIIVWALIILSFVETPLWCRGVKCVSPDGSDLLMSGDYFISTQASCVIELALVILLLTVFQYLRYAAAGKVYSILLKDKVYIVRMLLLLALLIDDIVVLSVKHPSFRFAPYLRASLAVVYSVTLTELFIGIVRLFPLFLDSLVVMTIFILFWSWLGALAFHEYEEAKQYFGTFGESVYSNFVCLTLADFPTRLVPLYNANRWTIFYFIIYLTFSILILFNIILAVVYQSYTKYMKGVISAKQKNQRRGLSVAFRLLASDGKGDSLTIYDCWDFFAEMGKNYNFSHLSRETVELVFKALDDNGDEQVHSAEFRDLVDVLHFRFNKIEKETLIERNFPTLFKSENYQRFLAFGKSRLFSNIIDGVLMLNLFFIVYQSSIDLDPPTRRRYQKEYDMFSAFVTVGFTLVYVGDMVVKLLVNSWGTYWKRKQNRVDFVATWLLVVSCILIISRPAHVPLELLRYVVVLRLLRLFSLLAEMDRLQSLKIFYMMIPASLPFFVMLFLSLFIFASAGLQLFGGLIYEGIDQSDQRVADYFEYNYQSINFNDLASSFVSVYELSLLGYFSEVADMFSAVTSNYARVYFIIYYVIEYLVLVNLLVAFVIDVFSHIASELKKSKDHLDTEQAELDQRYQGLDVDLDRRKWSDTRVMENMFQTITNLEDAGDE